MLGELADVLQTVGNLITAFDITDEELAQCPRLQNQTEGDNQ